MLMGTRHSIWLGGEAAHVLCPPFLEQKVFPPIDISSFLSEYPAIEVAFSNRKQVAGPAGSPKGDWCLVSLRHLAPCVRLEGAVFCEWRTTVTKREAMRSLGGAVLALFFFSNNIFPQGTQSGGISGSVADPAGAAVIGASVAIVNDATKNVERTAVTTAGGLFSATLLPPGDYTVIIKAPGFKVFTAKTPVLLNQTARLDAKLEVGAVTDVIEVTANTTQVNTESAVTGQPIDSATLQALPLAVPNFMFLLSLSAGTAGEFPDVRAANRGVVDINVNGQRTSNNSVTLEGINVNDFNLAHFDTIPLPNPHAIQEFNVATSLYDASSGTKGGGAVGLVFKSGTKDWHGEAYWQHRNDWLNANEWFTNQVGKPRGKFLQNVLGFSASGPMPFLGGFWFPQR